MLDLFHLWETPPVMWWAEVQSVFKEVIAKKKRKENAVIIYSTTCWWKLGWSFAVQTKLRGSGLKTETATEKKNIWLQTARPVSRHAEMPDWFEKHFFFPTNFVRLKSSLKLKVFAPCVKLHQPLRGLKNIILINLGSWGFQKLGFHRWAAWSHFMLGLVFFPSPSTSVV